MNRISIVKPLVFLLDVGISGEILFANLSFGQTVAYDVFFLVLGKMSLYDQSSKDEISLHNHHFVTEIMSKEGHKIVGGILRSVDNSDQVIKFKSEGGAFLAHGQRLLDAAALHKTHPDGTYIFDFKTQSGNREGQSLTLKKDLL